MAFTAESSGCTGSVNSPQCSFQISPCEPIFVRIYFFIPATVLVCSVYLVCVFFPFILDVKLMEIPPGVTQEEGHTGFLIHLPAAGLALVFNFLARRVQPFLSLVDCEVECGHVR